jgi:hypothetical protein
VQTILLLERGVLQGNIVARILLQTKVQDLELDDALTEIKSSMSRTWSSILSLMKNPPVHMALSVAVILASCSSLRTSYQYDAGAGFAELHTYAWLPIQMTEPGNRFVEDIFRRAVDRVLQAKGYSEVSDSPDFMISMYLGMITRSEIIDSGYRAEGWEGASHVHIYEEGTLIMDVLEASTRKVIWHGRATEAMSIEARQEAMTEAHNHAVEALLEHFPPPDTVARDAQFPIDGSR